MTSMCLFGTLHCLLPAVIVVLFRVCLSVGTSKACYGVQGLPCTKHTLDCSSGMIAIQDAYYTNSTVCGNGLSSCYITVSSIPDTGRYQDLNETQLNTLYRDCFNKTRCTFNGGRKSASVAFSIVKFYCINDSDGYNLCGHVNATTSDASLHWKRNKQTTDGHTCTCTISTLQSNTNLSVTALNMRFHKNRHLCPGVTISVDGNRVPVNCLQRSTYQLHNTSQQVQVTVNKGEAGVTGIRLQGSDNVNLICNEKLPPPTNFGTETVIAVVIPCLLIIVAIVLIAVFIIRRKKAETSKKDDKTNPNTKTQQEFSLAGDVHQNEYFEIEKSPAKMVKTYYANAGFVNTTGNARSKDHEVYSLAGVAHTNEYFEIEPTAPKNSLMAYDYAELSNTHASKSQKENVGPTTIQVQEDGYDHVGGKPVIQNGRYDTTASVAKTLSKSNSTDKNGDVYSYDHPKDKSTTDNANNDYDVTDRPSDYDTTASVQKRFDHATECREDVYGYNHLGNQVQKKTLYNDNDTSASAVTAVARLNSKTDESDYDHVTKDTGVDSVPSSGDIPENNEDDSDVYTLARKGDNPYQLAK